MMKSKKEEILRKINESNMFINVPYELQQGMGADQFRSLTMTIQHAVNMYVRDMLTTIVNDIYTHEDFEQDLQLE